MIGVRQRGTAVRALAPAVPRARRGPLRRVVRGLAAVACCVPRPASHAATARADSPYAIAAVAVEQPALPALIGAAQSAVARLRIDVAGPAAGDCPLAVSELHLHTTGVERLDDVVAVAAFYAGADPATAGADTAGLFGAAPRFGEAAPAAERLVLRGRQPLRPGPNYFWISYALRPDASLDRRVDAGCDLVVFADGARRQPSTANPAGTQRLGVAVRRGGDDGVHTYRIPGLAVSCQGTLLAVYDVRRRSQRDLPGDIDVGLSRSRDGGQTWEPMRILVDAGCDPAWQFDGAGDPAILVDRRSGAIWVAALWSHGDRGWTGSGPGLAPDETGQLLLVRSDDDGLSWTAPRNVTAEVKQPDWGLLLQGPGKGITMQDGTLVFAAQYQEGAAQGRLPRSTLLASRDGGATWEIGAGAFDDTTEAQVVELQPGELMLNCRYNRAATRVVCTTRDRGRTWHEHPTSRKDLVEPGACMASLIHVDRELGRTAGTRLLLSNPDDPAERRRMTIKLSPDHGATWPTSSRVLLDEFVSAGYSCLAMLDERHVGILYESSQAQLVFQRVRLDEFR